MQKLIAFIIMTLIALPAMAQDDPDDVDPVEPQIIVDAVDRDLSEFLWIKRPVIVFADSPADPRYIQQMEYITDRLDALDARDVVVLTDTDPAAEGSLRQEFRPRGFMLMLLDKNGTIYLRKPIPWDVREITSSIDKLPSRQREMREGTTSSPSN